tara:strand:+ start:469 stop:843 length:375 start_codon:yes stop_codon:yes gene_type:complete
MSFNDLVSSHYTNPDNSDNISQDLDLDMRVSQASKKLRNNKTAWAYYESWISQDAIINDEEKNMTVITQLCLVLLYYPQHFECVYQFIDIYEQYIRTSCLSSINANEFATLKRYMESAKDIAQQ